MRKDICDKISEYNSCYLKSILLSYLLEIGGGMTYVQSSKS